MLTKRIPSYATYAGKQELILNDIELNGRELYERALTVRSQVHSEEPIAIKTTYCDKFPAIFYAQVVHKCIVLFLFD